MTRKRSPIGLDVGSRWIKAVQVARGRQGVEIVAAAKVRRFVGSPEIDRAEADALLGVLNRQGFEGSRVVLAAPHEHLIRQGFDLPPRESGAPVGMLARAEMARVGRCAPDAMEMCWWETPAWARLGRGSGGPGDAANAGGAATGGGAGSAGAPVYAIAMPHAAAVAMMDALEECGLRVIAIDAPTTAAFRAVERSNGRAEEGGAPAVSNGGVLVELGWSTVCVSAFAGGVPVYERLLDDEGFGRVVARIRTELKVADEVAEHLVERVGLAAAAQAGPSDVASADRDRRQEPELLAAARKMISSHVDGLLDGVRASIAYAARRFAVGGGDDGPPVCIVGGGCMIPGLQDRLRQNLSAAARVVRPGACVPCAAESAVAASDPSFVCALGLALHDGSHPGDER